MFQSEKFFAPVSDIVRLHFTFRYPPASGITDLAARIGSGPSVAVHIRRGDYVTSPIFRREIGVLGSDYYNRALLLAIQHQPNATFYVFSDDIDAVAQELEIPFPHYFVRPSSAWPAHDELRLMSLCDHFVIANSTFSWWAAWLGTAENKLVIAPRPWFSKSAHDESDVVPSHWRRLAASEH
jgi:hypothetical protein